MVWRLASESAEIPKLGRGVVSLWYRLMTPEFVSFHKVYPMTYNILTPLYAIGPARAARGGFPYPNHGTIGQMDRRRAVIEKDRERRIAKGDFA